MFKTTGGYDRLLDKATSHILMNPDWPSILQICDLVRQNDVQPKYVMASLKKKLFSTNPHTALYSLLLLESLVKNCGSIFQDEFTLRTNCEMLHELAKTTAHENVKQKLLELVQAWSHAFRKNPKYGGMKEILDAMKLEGYKFPALSESDAMFIADTAPEWCDGEVCHRCRTAFNVLNRKHHCRNCGQVFCGQCSQMTVPLPKFGIEKEVRVCDACYDHLTKPVSKSKKISLKDDSELPAEYLTSSLAQQSQVPPRKTEDELREEEELQLALALSQSEAEAKEKAKPVYKVEVPHRTPSPQPPQPEETPNPELARYLNRSYWENKQTDIIPDHPASPSAPCPTPAQSENGLIDVELQDFISTLKSQVEIFINRMKSDCSRGRPVANDSSVQTLFLNITAMHSKLLRYIQKHDDSRLYFEGLQDKLTQVKDARAALDALRDEHREKLRRQAEEAERIRQLQMAHKLDIMRKKKQEYLQYQQQLALQRVQEQEREMQMRQEQQKQQYLMGAAGYGANYNGPGQFSPVNVGYRNYQFGQMASLPPNMQIMHGQIQGPPPSMPLPGMVHHQAPMQSQPVVGLQQIATVRAPPGLQVQVVRPQIPPGVGAPQQVLSQPNLHQPIPNPNMGGGMTVMHGTGSLGHIVLQQPGAPPASPQRRQNGEAPQTAELISFD